MFRIKAAGYYISENHSRLIKSAERITDCYELELCTTSGSKSSFDGKLYDRISGSVFIAKPGQRRSSINNFESHFIHFFCDDTDFCGKYIDVLPTQIFYADTYKFSQYMKDITFLSHSGENPEETRLICNAKLTSALLELFLAAKKQSTDKSGGYTQNISAACRYISENFSRHISIDEISQAAMLSPSFTYVMFKKAMGITPHEFLTDTRVKFACEQLIYTSKTVSQISLECGFSKENYLNYAFVKRIGITPGQYRKNHRHNFS